MKEEKKANQSKISLIIGSHAHVPSSASEKEFEYIYETRMRPFVSNLYRYSNIHAVLHYSGVLLYWVERTHPGFFMLIEDMINRKQAEILGGGFYEPVFPLIPLHDRIGQIELMTTYLRKHYGKRPQGCWLPGMVWEQPMANALCASDMTYTFLSQEQFLQAGMKGASLYSPCITEDQGKLIVVFPTALSVEKELAEKSFSHVFNELHKKVEKEFKSSSNRYSPNEKIICVFPEKVASSPEEAPDTAWNRFFEEISLSEKLLETTLPSKIIKTVKAYGKASFPNSSAYDKDFSPRRFLIDHDEVNNLYSKMILTNVLINQLKGDKSRKQNAREELWKAQDSLLFSPGNGYLRSEFRKAAYSSLLRAEKLTREKEKPVSSFVQYDFDFDGIKEFLFQDSLINCYIQQKGGSIFELDYLPKEWNYLDCGSDSGGIRCTAFNDLMVPVDSKQPSMWTDSNNNRLCFNEQYEAIEQNKKGKLCFKLAASGDEMVFGNIEVNKCYAIKKDTISVSYTLKNTGNEPLKFLFIPEIIFSFAGIGDELVRFYSDDPSGKNIHYDRQYNNISGLKILDVKNEVQLLLSSGNTFSVFLSPSFKNELYQATKILPIFSAYIKARESWSSDFSLKFSH
ncbi:MAG: alpha-amylase [Treponema sp.]|nr:alpha-amylase [Treponema sp.]